MRRMTCILHLRHDPVLPPVILQVSLWQLAIEIPNFVKKIFVFELGG